VVMQAKGVATKTVYILGIRGIPGRHGGFETFAEHFALYMIDRGWKVFVYCQEDNVKTGMLIREEEWRGVTKIVVPINRSGSFGSVEFDWRCSVDVKKRLGVVLILGYNTGIFAPLIRISHRRFAINMDGIEWMRGKWSLPIRAWFWVNEKIAAWAGTTLIADHPEIANHLARRAERSKIVTIPYGALSICDAVVEPLNEFGVIPDKYLISICRIEPENLVLELVRAFSFKSRGYNFVVVGPTDPANRYHRAVRAASSSEVLFVGAIYDRVALASLRWHARAYCHGHTVGGTNPSLVEALGAGNAILAHDNKFNRWTAGDQQFFFTDVASCGLRMDEISLNFGRVFQARRAARARFEEAFQLNKIHSAYEAILEDIDAGIEVTKRFGEKYW